MKKQIQIKIYPNGEVKAKTIGVKGKNCLQYISQIEELTNSITFDSAFTDEYLETDSEIDIVNEQHIINTIV